MNRELDGKIAEIIFGWILTKVGKDANGQNESEILTEYGEIPKDFKLPNLGKIGKPYLTPLYSSSLHEAIKLAKHVKLPISELTYDILSNPTEIAQKCLDYFTSNKKVNVKPMIPLVVYGVMNKEGYFFRKKYSSSFVEDINNARVYKKMGPANSIVTYFRRRFPNEPLMNVISLKADKFEIIDQSDRIKKKEDAAARKKAKRDQRFEYRRSIESIMTDVQGKKMIFLPDFNGNDFDNNFYSFTTFSVGDKVRCLLEGVTMVAPWQTFDIKKEYVVKEVQSYSSSKVQKVPFILVEDSTQFVHPAYFRRA